MSPAPRQGAMWAARARAWSQELKRDGVSQRVIAERHGVSENDVSTAMRLARCSAPLLAELERNEITIAEAMAQAAPKPGATERSLPRVPADDRRRVRVVPPEVPPVAPEDAHFHAFDVVLAEKELLDVVARCRALGVQPGAIGRKLFTSWLRQAVA